MKKSLKIFIIIIILLAAIFVGFCIGYFPKYKSKKCEECETVTTWPPGTIDPPGTTWPPGTTEL